MKAILFTLSLSLIYVLISMLIQRDFSYNKFLELSFIPSLICYFAIVITVKFKQYKNGERL